MHNKTFAELYCESRGLKPQQYMEAVLKETLYPQARLIKRLLPWYASRHFASDVEFVNSVGLLRRFRDFTFESEEFAHHPENSGFWRVTANLRVSTRRMRRLVRRTLHPELAPGEVVEDHTSVPFTGDQAKASHPSQNAHSSAS
ncbi:MAG: hypothetical protein H7067_04975 [Burkholderiales bacterium]|nr:hypothetical protein [Opitutaceae bacterium]